MCIQVKYERVGERLRAEFFKMNLFKIILNDTYLFILQINNTLIFNF